MKILLSLFIFCSPLYTEPSFAYKPIDDPGETLRQCREAKKILKRKFIQETLAKLEKASFGISLNDDQKKVLLNCLAEDGSACKELLTCMREKCAQDLATIKEAAQNGRLLAEIIDDPSVADDVKIELVIPLQRKAIDYLNKLNELIPAQLHLYRFKCECPEVWEEDSYSGSSYNYVFISTKQNDSLIYKEVRLSSDLFNEIEDNYTKNFKTIESFKTRRFLKKISSSRGCVSPEPWQNLVIPVWDGKITKLNSAYQTDVQTICARSGVLSKVLLYLYYKPTDNFIKELSTLNTYLNNPLAFNSCK